MCYSYITYLTCENCGEVIPGSRGYYNIPEHNPPCKLLPSGHYKIRPPPEIVKGLTGGMGRIQGVGKMADCLECSAYAKQELREMEEEKAKKEKAKAKAKVEVEREE